MKNRVSSWYSAACRLGIAGALALSFLPGCATLLQESADGETAGIAPRMMKTGTFRGRWWNYYQRGMQSLDRGQYAAAEEDFQTALVTRTRDQLWPRTYGLHFLPEYFPNRELGITQYYQGNYDVAEAQIARSLDEQYSARGAYYLDELRKKRIAAAGGDQQPPTFQIASGASTIGTLDTVVRGTARDNAYVSQIYVNNERLVVRVSAPEIPFEHVVKLSPGENSIPVRIVDLSGNETESAITLATDVDGPSVSLEDFDPASPRIAGEVFDPSGIEYVEVLGQRLTPGAGDGTSMRIDLPLAQAGGAPLTYRAADRLGNITFGSLAPERTAATALLHTAGLSMAFPPWPYWMPAVTTAFMLGGAPQAEGIVRARLHGAVEGQQFFSDTIVVLVEVSSPVPLQSVSLNGTPMYLAPGVKKFRQSRQIALTPGDNEILLEATDMENNLGTATLNVGRVEPKVEGGSERLTVAFMGNIATAPDADTEEAAMRIFEDLPAYEAVVARFDVVDRSLIDEVLTEQALSASDLVGPKAKLLKGKIKAAEALFTGKVRVTQESIEVVLEGTSTETTTKITPRIEAASDDIDRLLEDLALRLVQEFPRATGHVTGLPGDKFQTDLGLLQGVRRYYKCVIYRPEPNEVDGVVTGNLATKPVFEGILEAVDNQSSTGMALLTDSGEDADAVIALNDIVVAK